MCTVTWLAAADGYRLFCNRDELFTRQPALGPAVHKCNGVRCIAPLDGDFGGSWLAVNVRGLTLTLLNRYPAPAPQPSSPSRGLFLTSLMDCASQSEVASRVDPAAVARYSPFLLAAFEPGEPALVVAWDGDALSVKPEGDACMPLTSSSIDPDQVARQRRAYLERVRAEAGSRLTSESLEAYHRSHHPEPSAYSVCMHGPHATTTSFSMVTVSGGGIEFLYQPGAPCEEQPRRTIRLPRD